MCVNTKIFCRKIKGMYFGGLKVLKSRNRKLYEKVGVNRRPRISHFSCRLRKCLAFKP